MTTLKRYKPTSPGLRGLVSIKNSLLSKCKPQKNLTVHKKNSAGRNNQGRITAWKRGGGHKKKYRLIDWKRSKHDIPAKIEQIEYDPNRSPYIALLLYQDGERKYILCPNESKIGDIIVSGYNVPIEKGNNTLLKNIPVGTLVHCIELIPGSGAKLARSAGCYAQFLAKDSTHATLRLRSGEIRKVLLECFASIGILSKSEHNLRKLGKAGRNRWLGIKPRVRGVAMNPVDHPLGGGEGKTSGGRHPCTPWGKPEGKITRKNKKHGYKLIIKSRRK
ncbi:MAG TPA: 50S ribosomal protein L2 [Candidatus Azoamicus sp. OHIO2]